MTDSNPSRLLKFINIAIAIVLAAALALVWWFCLRPLPVRSGTLAAAVAAPVRVDFDPRGVPHIRAGSLEDALFVQGYVTAQDRLWQMDGLRRMAAGDLAEIVGAVALESDRESRRMRMRRIAEEAYLSLPPADRAGFGAYARGVNAFITTHRGSLPLEFTLLNYQPRPWSEVDSLLICLYMFRDLTTTWRDEANKRDMLLDGDARKVNFLFPIRTGGETQPGSNAWALAGSRTASGKPLLSNDMHLQFGLPGIWYMAHIEAPGLDAAGVTLPGTPGVTVGHNRRIAWGITNLGFDVQDLYIEQIDDRTGRYLYRGQMEQARRENEIIRVKGQAPVDLQVWVTRHGPLFLSDRNQQLALRWTAAEPGMLQFPVLDIDRAQNWDEFTAALSRWPGPGSNFVYADVDGHIGYHAAGKLPIRHGWAGDLPVDGSKGEFEWDGYIPFDELPEAFDPPGGIIATANQNPFPADYRYAVNGNFAPYYRARQIRDRLSCRKDWHAADLLSVQKDVYSASNKFLAEQVVADYDRRGAGNPAMDPAIALLRSWNGQMNRDLAAPFLISLVYQHVRTAMAESATPGKSQRYTLVMAAAVMERLLRERPAGWFGDYDQMLLGALVDAVEEGSRTEGRDIGKWRYGRYWTVTLSNPVIHQVPLVGKYFDIGPLPMSGSSTTVKQTTHTLGPSMRMNADLGDWDRSLLNIVTGQSGQAFSSHYRDQWPAYYEARGFPMPFDKVEVKSTLEFQPDPR